VASGVENEIGLRLEILHCMAGQQGAREKFADVLDLIFEFEKALFPGENMLSRVGAQLIAIVLFVLLQARLRSKVFGTLGRRARPLRRPRRRSQVPRPTG
jgi:hypothetical protein